LHVVEQHDLGHRGPPCLGCSLSGQADPLTVSEAARKAILPRAQGNPARISSLGRERAGPAKREPVMDDYF
jgi:hypothetical protein